MVPLEKLSRALSSSYAVIRQIGHGGHASVYLARDLRHDRDIALKVLDPAVATSVGTDRFLREIRTTAQLNHPHIIPLYDSGEAEGYLYLVVPYLEAESLRDRLKREGRLPIRDAFRIAAELGDALAYAHAHGFIHRDVKPENVLIGHAGHTYLADFGLARAVLASSDERLTASGLIAGTPAYVSPEQISGSGTIGPASDVYSLGCLLHELLTGKPPFHGSTVHSIFAAHIGADPPPVRAIRREVPVLVERLLLEALAKEPAARPDANELVARLQRALANIAPVSTWRIPRRMGWPLAVFAVGLLAFAAARFGSRHAPSSRELAALDTSLHVVFPFEGDTLEQGIMVLLPPALGRWDGIGVVDPRILRSTLSPANRTEIALAEAAKVARTLGAGRFVLGSVTGLRTLEATLYDATSSPTVAVGMSRTVSIDQDGLSKAVNTLADSLLFPGLAAIDGPTRPGATHSATALRAYARGHAELNSWQLETADSAFSRAIRADPEFGEAYLWLAQVRGWASDDTTAIGTLARQAESHVDSGVDLRYGRLARALTKLAAREFVEACDVYRSLIGRDSRDFVAWYGLGECQRRDSRVVPDRASPSRFAFRSSYHAAIEAYERAFEIRPAMLAMFAAGSYEGLFDRLFYIGGARWRIGRGADRQPFYAFPGWSGDSLVFVPYPGDRLPAAEIMLRTHDRAILENRKRVERLTGLWMRSQPESAEALEARAIAFAMLGDREAFEKTFARARSLAVDEHVAVRIAAEQSWLALRQSLPDDIEGFERALGVADSLLESTASWSDTDRHILAGFAVLGGRCDLTGRLLAADPAEDDAKARWSHDAVTDAYRLLGYAALGVRVDSMAVLEARVRQRIDQLPADERAEAKVGLLFRAAILAFPVYRFKSLDELPGISPRLDAQRALAKGDVSAASSLVDRELAAGAISPPGLRTIDAVLIEAWILDQLGRTTDAAAHLERGLLALEYGNPFLMRDAVQVASLVRAITLLIDISDRSGNKATRDRWARAIDVLGQHHSTRLAAEAPPFCSS